MVRCVWQDTAVESLHQMHTHINSVHDSTLVVFTETIKSKVGMVTASFVCSRKYLLEYQLHDLKESHCALLLVPRDYSTTGPTAHF